MKQLLIMILTTLLLYITLVPNIYAETENTASISVQVTSPSAIISPSAITLVRFDETDRVYGAAFATGTAQEKIADYISNFLDDFVGYDIDGMDYLLMADNWSFADVDTNTPGLYYALAVPELGGEYVLAEDVSLPEMRFAVSIQPPGKPSLDNCFAYLYSLWFPLVLSEEQAAQPEAFTVWLQQDGGAWTLLTLDDEYWIQTNSLIIAQYAFDKGSSYTLKLVCPDGETSIATFLYKGDLTVVDDYNGDRDGGDVLGGGSGVGSQPAPTPPEQDSDDSEPKKEHEQPFVHSEPQEEQNSLPDKSQPKTATLATPTELVATVYSDTSIFDKAEKISYKPINHTVSKQKDDTKFEMNPISDSEPQQPAIVSESYSPTKTVISGLRLKDLCAEKENIVFGSGDLTVSIPSNLLLSLNLSDSDTLTVQLTQPQNDKILLTVEVSGKSITELPGAVLRFRYMMKSKNAEIIVQNEAGQHIADTSFDGELLRFNADTAGTYTILEISDAQNVQNSTPIFVFLIGGLILTVGGIACYWRRRHG